MRANNLLQFTHQVTIELRFRTTLAQERFKSNFEFRYQIIVLVLLVVYYIVYKIRTKDQIPCIYSKTCVKRPYSKIPKMVFKADYRLIQVKSIAECSKGSTLQYFRPSISYQLSLRSLFCLSLSGRLTQVVL